jgi:cell cycle sensor histidine kinase DivJ
MIADRRALGQILLNLLSNAIRFTDHGGKVTISARAEAARIIFVVEDSGVGISSEDLARVGEPYFQARASYDRRHGGTGLGLSIVKGLLRLHGGELTIRSRLGEGTRVTVRMPLDCERARRETRLSAPAVSTVAAPLQARTPKTGTGAPASVVLDGEERASDIDMRVKKSA